MRKSERCPGAVSGDINKGYFLYQICILFSLLIFLCSCRIPYSKASAVGGQPEREEKGGREEGHRAGTCTELEPADKVTTPGFIPKLTSLWLHGWHRQECKETKLMVFIKKIFIKHSNSLISAQVYPNPPPTPLPVPPAAQPSPPHNP